MARTDLKIYSKIAATGKNSTTNITHVNSEATSQQLKGLATRLNALTTNEYQQADRVNTINVDTEDVPTGGKTAPTFTVGQRYTGDHFAACFPLTYDGDGTVNAIAAVGSQGSIRTYNGTYADNVVTFASIGTETIAVVAITATETENYGSAGITITNSTPPQ